MIKQGLGEILKSQVFFRDTNIYKIYSVVESHDSPRPEVTQYLKDRKGEPENTVGEEDLNDILYVSNKNQSASSWFNCQ